MAEARIRPLIVHQMDPFGNKIGGIQTFLRSFIKYAPKEFSIGFVGVTSDPVRRPVGRWTREMFGDTPIDVFPVMAVDNENVKKRVPLSLRFTFHLWRYRKQLDFTGRTLELHRIEPYLAVASRPCRKILFVHSDMDDYLHSPETEAKWKSCPWLFFSIERMLMRRIDRIFVVREDTVAAYQKKFPDIADRFSFAPTWVDQEVFHPIDGDEKNVLRDRLLREQGLPADSHVLLFAGRIEGAKDPLLLADVFSRVCRAEPRARLVVIGTGDLQPAMEARLKECGVAQNVRFLGMQPQRSISQWMAVAKLLVLTSAFEGMPRIVMESLGSGLPVVSTDVGEVKRVVKNDSSGAVCADRSADTIASAILVSLSNPMLTSENCVAAIHDYTAQRVLSRIYQSYYQLESQS